MLAALMARSSVEAQTMKKRLLKVSTCYDSALLASLLK
jgi:hypothetical protein